MNNHLEKKSVLNSADDIGSCVLCGSKSVCKCQRCGDFYCSPQCQRKDWPNHRYICFPMPPLVKASLLKECERYGNEIPTLQSQVQVPDKNVPKEVKQIMSKEIHPEKTKMPKNESCVILTSFSSSNRCYIRSTNPSDVENYKTILKEIDEFGKTAPSLSDKPTKFTYALTLKEDKWCRVEICNNKDRKIGIRFIDYGYHSLRKPNELRQINNRLISLPCFLHIVQLKDIKAISTFKHLMDALRQYTNIEYKLVIENEDNILGGNVKLFNWKTKALLNAEIAQLCSNFDVTKNIETDLASNVSSLSNETELKKDIKAATSNKPSNQSNGEITKANSPKTVKRESGIGKNKSPSSNTKRTPIQKPLQIEAHKPCLEPPFKLCPLTENDSNCKVVITDDTYAEIGYIGCVLDKYCDNLKEVTTFLKENGVRNQPYKPKLNEYCLAEFENEWYRAEVIKVISDDKYRVMYIDFTNEMELTSKSIRRYPMSLTLPCYTTLCAIDGLPKEISDELKNFLKSECMAFSELHIDSVRMEQDACYIESKDLLKKLHEKKLI